MGFSPFFMNLLRKNKHPHPLIYMRGVKSIDLVPIVDFLYFGEANVYQENLDSFLAVAEELQLKGLMGSGAGKEVEELNNTSTTKRKSLKPLKQRIFTQQEALTPNKSSSVAKVETSPQQEGTVALADYTVAADLQDMDNKIKSMMVFSENHAGGNNGKARICKVCGKEGQYGNIRAHIEAIHITGVSHKCNICGKVSRTRDGYGQHMSNNHSTGN